MKISVDWLKDFVSFPWDADELAAKLTLCGLEVEETETFETLKGGLKGVVVGEVLQCEQHPNADRLRICKVNVGKEAPLNIVCGASNVAAGQKVVVATIGTTLHPVSGQPIQIEKSKIRGEVSEGMICAEDELGLGESHAGIIVLDAHWKPGTPAAQVFQVRTDHVLSIGLTANRADAASHFGVARDIAALQRTKANLPEPKPEMEGKCPVTIKLLDEDRCPRYVGIEIRGVQVSESPAWIQNRLKAIGLRPINNIVDVTNYVLHEMGQPLHAFDADKIRGGEIVVKTLDAETVFTTLDGQERKILPGTDLMICDANGPVAIAGVMGGGNSEVDASTRNIFLESAWFQPASVRKTARRLGLSSDASYRFERGLDPGITQKAALRAAQLILETAGGKASLPNEVQLKTFHPFSVSFDLKKANRLMGRDFSADEVTDILGALEIRVLSAKGDTLLLEVPPYRVDVLRPQDIMEEILRIYGLNRIESPGMNRFVTGDKYVTGVYALRRRLAERLAGAGWREIVVNSLVGRNWQKDHTVNLLNNLSEDMAVLRNEMIIPVLEIIAHNHNRRNSDLRLFEFGKTFFRNETGNHESEKLALYMTGKNHPTDWKNAQKDSDFFTLAGATEALLNWLGIEAKYSDLEQDEWLAYGRSFKVNGKPAGRLGELKAEILQQHDIRGSVLYAEIDWKIVSAASLKKQVRYQEVPRYPSTRRDISMLVPENLGYAQIRDAVIACNPKLIRDVSISDVYKGEKIAEGRKSYLINLTLLDSEKTITDENAEKLMEKVFRSLEEKLGAEIRK